MAGIQEALFDFSDVPTPPALSVKPGDPAPGRLYVAHFEQRTGPPMWKLGYTEAWPEVRAKQIACVPVAWWPGSGRDERKMHRRWKHHRVSPATEFFYHSDDINRWVLARTQDMPPAWRAKQLAILAEIFMRLKQPPAANTA